MGSTRGELQHWKVDLDKQTARIVKTGYRQLEKMAPRLSVKELAEEIAERILSGEDDERIKRLDDGSVKLLVSKIVPIGSAFQRTVSGRTKAARQVRGREVSQVGWVETGSYVFNPPAK